MLAVPIDVVFPLDKMGRGMTYSAVAWPLPEPITATHHGAKLAFSAHYAAEMARQEMLERYGMAAYNDGFHVYTTISSELQQLAQQAVINGLITYDKRHGFRGPERQLPPAD